VDLALAASNFNQAKLDGYDPTVSGTWVLDVARGTLQVYDRFVSDRTFGAKKRILEIGKRSKQLPAKYGVIRVPGGRTYMVESVNEDIDVGPYSDVYVLHEALERIEVYDNVTTDLPSGLPGSPVETLLATYWGDSDRFGSSGTQFDQVRREVDVVWLEPGAVVLPTHKIKVGGLHSAGNW
jgi:hypothetical protein